MRIEGREIAVIGAGVGGLAAAVALAQRGARVQVFEQAPALAEVGAGLQLGPNGVAVIEALGLRSAAEAVASLPEAIECASTAPAGWWRA
jgi:salicylate hydroxylase